MHNTRKILLGCLVLLVAIAAVVIAVHEVKKNSHATPLGKVVHTSGPLPQPPVRKPNPLTTDPQFMDVLTATPGSAGYSAIISAQAVPTSVVHITNCRPYPQVASVQLGRPVKIYNVDAVARTLKGTSGSGFNLTVPAKGSALFTPKGAAGAPFTYTCGGSAAGAMVTSN